MASLSFDQITSMSFRWRATGLTKGDKVRVFIRYADDSSSTVYDIAFDATGSSAGVIVTNAADEIQKYIKPNKKYVANIAINGEWVYPSSNLPSFKTLKPSLTVTADSNSITYKVTNLSENHTTVYFLVDGVTYASNKVTDTSMSRTVDASSECPIVWDTYYEVSVIIDDGYVEYECWDEVWTDAPPLSFWYGDVTKNSVYVYVSGIASGYKVYIIIREKSTGNKIYGSTAYTATATWLDKTFTGLNPKTTYTLNVKITSGDSSYMDEDAEVEFTTLAGKPEPWEWDTVVERGQTIQLTAEEWNNFMARINEFRVYLDMLEINDFTEAERKTTPISESICNEAWYAISGMVKAEIMPDMAVQGEPITAAFFNGLKDALNSIE